MMTMMIVMLVAVGKECQFCGRETQVCCQQVLVVLEFNKWFPLALARVVMKLVVTATVFTMTVAFAVIS